MKKLLCLLLACLALPVLADPTPTPSVPAQLQDEAVTIVADHAEGSGVIFTRKLASGQSVCFVWTAGHVVADLRHEQELILPDGTKRTQVIFKDPTVKRRLVQDGREIGWDISDAEVIRYSNANTGEDLALLRVRKKNFSESSVRFYVDDAIPEIGTPLFHVGSFLGDPGAGSMSDGRYSQVGRIFAATVFDQTSVTAFPGSSGGGVFLQDGRYIGMLVRGAAPTFNFIVPVRRIRAWAFSAQVYWAIDQSVPAPTDEELSARKLSVETPGTNLPIDGDEQSEEAHFLIKRVD